MRRRELLSVIIGAVVARPRLAIAQAGHMRRVGVLMSLAENDPETKRRVSTLQDALQKLGWSINGKLRIDYRWSGGEAARIRSYAAELVGLELDAILAVGSPVLTGLMQATSKIPIVFVQVADPVDAGFVASLAHPGGNVTGFTNFEYATGIKWLELLTQMAPQISHVGVLRDPTVGSGIGLLGAIQGAAAKYRVEVTPVGVRDSAQIEQGIGAFAQGPNKGLIVLAGTLAAVHRDLIVRLAADHRLPTIYPYRYFVASGGLMSYGADNIPQYRQAASYIDRILKGEKPADLPVQNPIKYDLVINANAAKALALGVPDKLLAIADEVIE
jgi:putative ABC transport system substrate-binding protein